MLWLKRVAAVLMLQGVITGLGVAVAMPAMAADMTGPSRCIECHESAHEVWKGTKHFSTGDSMSKAPSAKQIADKLGIKRIKDPGSSCAQCHFTTATVEGRPKIVGGVTCESCHGPASDWIEIHNEFGGPGVKKEQESPEHRNQRLAAVEKAGMLRPGRIYDFARNCYGCHLVINENLVETGGHGTGKDFELLSRFTGNVIHGPRPDAAKKRLIKVAGYGAAMEMALRGIANASKEDTNYLQTLRGRLADAHASLTEINGKAGNAGLKAALAAAAETAYTPGNRALLAAADKVRRNMGSALQGLNGGQLAFMDGMTPIRGAKLPATGAAPAAATAAPVAAAAVAAAPAAVAPVVRAATPVAPPVVAPPPVVAAPVVAAPVRVVPAAPVAVAPVVAAAPVAAPAPAAQAAPAAAAPAPAPVAPAVRQAAPVVIAPVAVAPPQPAPVAAAAPAATLALQVEAAPPPPPTAPISADAGAWWLTPAVPALCHTTTPWRLGEVAGSSLAAPCGSVQPPVPGRHSHVFAVAGGQAHLLWSSPSCGAPQALAGREPWPTLMLPAGTTGVWLLQNDATVAAQVAAAGLLPAGNGCGRALPLAVGADGLPGALAALVAGLAGSATVLEIH